MMASCIVAVTVSYLYMAAPIGDDQQAAMGRSVGKGVERRALPASSCADASQKRQVLPSLAAGAGQYSSAEAQQDQLMQQQGRG